MLAVLCIKGHCCTCNDGGNSRKKVGKHTPLTQRYKSKVRENKQQQQERLSHIAVKIEIARPISLLSIQQI